MISINYIVNSFFSSRTYMVSGDRKDRIWLVDCGDIDIILKQYPDTAIEGVLLTHTHSDHIYGLNRLLEHFPEVKLVTNEYGVGALVSPKINLSRYHADYGDIIVLNRSNIIVVCDGNELDILEMRCVVYETPGHDPSCLCFQIDDALFTGDAYIPGIKVFTGFPYSNKVKAKESLDRILCLSKGLTVYPGHEFSLEKSD